MNNHPLDFGIKKLGGSIIPSPLAGMQFIDERQRVVYRNSLAEISPLFHHRDVKTIRVFLYGMKDRFVFRAEWHGAGLDFHPLR